MKVIRVLGIVVLALIVVAIAIPLLIDVNQFRPRLEAELSNALGRQVKVGNLKLSVFSGSVVADDLSISDDPAFSKSAFLTAKSLKTGVEWMPLIASRKVRVTGFDIEQPQIDLRQDASGKWNFATLGAGSQPKPAAAPEPAAAPLDLSVKEVRVRNGHLSLARSLGRARPLVLDQVNIGLKEFSLVSVMPFTMTGKLAGGGDVKLEGKAGPIRTGNSELTPFNASLKVTHLDLIASGLLDPSTGIAGIASVDGTADSDGKRLEAKGRLRADQLRLVKGASPAQRPVEFDFTVDQDLATRAGSLTRGDVHIGRARASLTGNFAPRGESMALNAHLSGSEMAIEELEAMLPALNIALPSGSSLKGGAAQAKLNIEGTLENLTSTGFLGLNNVKLAGFDLGHKLAVIETLAGLKSTPETLIENLSANVKNSNDGTSIQDLKLVVADIGELRGNGSISPSQALDFRMIAAVKSGMLPAAIGSRLQAGVPFFVRGTARDPKFEPDVKGIAEQQIEGLKGEASKAAGGLLDQLLNKKKK